MSDAADRALHVLERALGAPSKDKREVAIDLVYAIGRELGVPVRTVPIEVLESAVSAATSVLESIKDLNQ